MGVWAEDTLDDDRRLWLIGPNGDPTPSQSIFAARIFDSGLRQVTLSPIVGIPDRIANVLQKAHTTGRRPYRRSLAATVYGLTYLNGQPPISAVGWKFVDDVGAELRPRNT